MSYTPPDVSSIDLSGAQSGYSAPAVSSIDLSGSGTTEPSIVAELTFSAEFIGSASTNGTIQAELGFVPVFEGGHHVGSLDAALGFTAALQGIQGVQGTVSASLDFSASLQGEAASTFGDVQAALGITAQFQGFQDWTANLPATRLQEFYTLTITGTPDMTFRISSWQATMNQGERSNYLQAVVPAAANIIDEIRSRSSGELIVSKGYRFDDGSERSEEILRSKFDNFRYDRGPRNFTVTVSGYAPANPSQKSTRALKGVRSLSLNDGKLRARCDIDLFLKPGMTVEALGESFTASYINFFVSSADKFCEVSQR